MNFLRINKVMDCKRTKGINNSILNILIAVFMFLAGAATISGCSINNGAVNDQSDAYKYRISVNGRNI